MVSVASYSLDKVTVPASKMFQWPPIYSTMENLTLVFTASISQEGLTTSRTSRLRTYSREGSEAIKFKLGQNYTNNCTGATDTCWLNAVLSALPTGQYFMELTIVDDLGSKQSDTFEFEIRNMLLAVPQIYEGWTRDSSTPDKNLNAWSGEDSCDNS